MATSTAPRPAASLRRWSRVHTGSSLVCTVFLLMLCITGLPLIFHHELEPLLGTLDAPATVADGTVQLDLDRVVEAARDERPGDHVHMVFSEAGEDSVVYVGMGETPEAPMSDDIGVFVDWNTGNILGTKRFGEGGILDILLALHVDMFAGLPGKLFLGLMALLFMVALVSGVVVYAPFLRGRKFGAVRRDRGPRLAWLDLHNAIGIVTLCWALVVGGTGMVNTWADLLLRYWQVDELATMIETYQDQPILDGRAAFASSVETAVTATPDFDFAFAAFPGTAFAGAHHYAIFLRGRTSLTSRLLHIVLVDAATGEVTESRSMPWYITALLLSQPLHFGDYGGMPLKILWAVLDVITIVLLGSGLYLWWQRRRQRGDSAAFDQRSHGSHTVRGNGRESARWWPVPIALALASLAGLLGALLSDGVGDLASWLALGVVAATAVLVFLPRRPYAGSAARTTIENDQEG